MTYKEAREYIETISVSGSVLGLENIKILMDKLSNPQDSLAFVHVAGTNGKGSVSAYIASVLEQAGYVVGRYISPTIFRYLERIQVNGSNISQKHFAEHMSRIRDAITAMEAEGFPRPTVFEAETAAAFLEFSMMKCDIVVLETGLGGRLDSTNIIRTAKVGVITSVSMDHMQFLGNTLEEIAVQKAGIVKPGMKIASYGQAEFVSRILRETCEKNGAEYREADFTRLEVLSSSLSGTALRYKGIGYETSLLGENQPRNLAVALEALFLLRQCGYFLTDAAIQAGIQHTSWEGRFSIVSRTPLVIADGAHNEEAAVSLAKSLRLYFGDGADKKIIHIIGVFKDKEYEKLLQATLNKKDTVYTVTPPGPRGLSAGQLAACAGKYCARAQAKNSVKSALLEAEKEKPDGIIVYGSLSFLGEVYAYYGREEAEGEE